MTKDQFRDLLVLADSRARDALGAPQRDGVELELDDAGVLDLYAELMYPLAQKHGELLSPEVRAGVAGSLMVLELAADAQLMQTGIEGGEGGESDGPTDDGPMDVEDFRAQAGGGS